MSEAKPSLVRNTLYLYGRAIFVMFLGFYTARLTLQALGVEDYGVVNVVGSVVSLFTMISSVMLTATTRYYNVELAKGGAAALARIFNVTSIIYVGLVIVFILCAETVGIWIFLEKLNLPESRQTVALFFYQISIVCASVNLLQVPYAGIITAYEDMRSIAFVGMFDAVVKVTCVALLCVISYERVLLYGCILLLISCINMLVYVTICKNRFNLYKPSWVWDKNLMLELFKFSGWNLGGALAAVCSNLLVNVLLNNYFGVVINAARGVAMQVSKAANIFVSNFVSALNPRIMKLYAAGNMEASHRLASCASRYCFMLFWGMSLPLLVYTPELLGIWLTEVPDYAVIFTRLVLLQALVDSMSFPLMCMAQATGKIAVYQLIVGGVLMLNLPLSWCGVQLYNTPEVCFIVAIGVAGAALIARLVILRRIAGFSLRTYFRECLMRCALICMGALILYFPIFSGAGLEHGRHLTNVWSYIYVVLVIALSYCFGVNEEERKKLHLWIRKKFGGVED